MGIAAVSHVLTGGEEHDVAGVDRLRAELLEDGHVEYLGARLDAVRGSVVCGVTALQQGSQKARRRSRTRRSGSTSSTRWGERRWPHHRRLAPEGQADQVPDRLEQHPKLLAKPACSPALQRHRDTHGHEVRRYVCVGV